MDEITFLAKRVKLTFALEFTGPSENLSLHQQKQNHAVNNMGYKDMIFMVSRSYGGREKKSNLRTSKMATT